MRKKIAGDVPPVRTQLISSPELIDRINVWRGLQPGVPSKSEAIRRLIERSLDEDEPSAPRL